MKKQIYIRNIFPKEFYPIKGQMELRTRESNIPIKLDATIYYADLLSLTMGVSQDEIIVQNFNIQDFFPHSNEYDYEVIDITTGKKIMAKQIEFKANNYPLPEYYDFSFKFKTQDYQKLYQIHKHKIEENVKSHITITGKCKTSHDFEIGTDTKIKLSFYPIFFSDNDELQIDYEVDLNE